MEELKISTEKLMLLCACGKIEMNRRIKKYLQKIIHVDVWEKQKMNVRIKINYEISNACGCM